MKINTLLPLVIFSTFTMGCATVPYVQKNYTVGETKIASIGDPIFSISSGTYDPGSMSEVKSPNHTIELTYSGIEENSIVCTYREYYQNLIKDSYSQEYRYNISNDKTCSYKGLQFNVVEANNNFIKYTIMRDMHGIEDAEVRADSIAHAK